MDKTKKSNAIVDRRNIDVYRHDKQLLFDKLSYILLAASYSLYTAVSTKVCEFLGHEVICSEILRR